MDACLENGERKAKAHGVPSVTVVLIFAVSLKFAKPFLKLALYRSQYGSLLGRAMLCKWLIV
jgi:hypothetical protein